MVVVACYTIYHSPNAYLGCALAERRLRGLPVVAFYERCGYAIEDRISMGKVLE